MKSGILNFAVASSLYIIWCGDKNVDLEVSSEGYKKKKSIAGKTRHNDRSSNQVRVPLLASNHQHSLLYTIGSLSSIWPQIQTQASYLTTTSGIYNSRTNAAGISTNEDSSARFEDTGNTELNFDQGKPSYEQSLLNSPTHAKL